MRNHGEVGEPRLLRDQIVLAPGHRGEIRGRARLVRPGLGNGDAVRPDEVVEHRAHRLAARAALLLGRGHHLLDHRAGQAFARQRRDIARIDADMQRRDMRVPDTRDHQRGGKRRLAGRRPGQGQQQLPNRDGTLSRLGHGVIP